MPSYSEPHKLVKEEVDILYNTLGWESLFCFSLLVFTFE